MNIVVRQELTHNPAGQGKKAEQLLQVFPDPIEASLLCVVVVAGRCGGVELTRRVKILFSANGGDQHFEFGNHIGSFESTASLSESRGTGADAGRDSDPLAGVRSGQWSFEVRPAGAC